MKIIVNVDLDWGIGLGNLLLENIKEDMKFFRDMTIGKIVVLGRKTLESLPGCRPLKDRINIILTSNNEYKCEGAMICHSIDDLFTALDCFNPEDVFVIGGESVYNQLLLYCSKAYVTKNYLHHNADKHFPDLDKHPGWILTCSEPTMTANDIQFNFNTYENINVINYKDDNK